MLSHEPYETVEADKPRNEPKTGTIAKKKTPETDMSQITKQRLLPSKLLIFKSNAKLLRLLENKVTTAT